MRQILTKKKRASNRLLQATIIIAALFLVALQWLTDAVKPNHLIFNVHQIAEIPFFETRYLYVYLHLFALIPVLLLSFDRRVHYYTYWKALFPALLIVAVFFWIWDLYKTSVGVWGFNPKYYTFLILNLPIEEWLFFFTFPFASVFIYECLNAYFPKDRLSLLESYITPLLVVFFFVVGILFWKHAYTVTTFLLCGGFWLYHYLFVASSYRGRFYRSMLVGYVPFIVVNGILTGAFTLQPVVVYNPEEYLGVRLISIPLDDFAYNFLLQAAVITLYEIFKKKWGLSGTISPLG